MSNGERFFETPPADPDRRFSRFCYVGAVSVTIFWFCIYASLRDGGLCDEGGHFGVLHHFASGKPGLPADLPTLPGYHFVVLTLSGGQVNDTWPRFTTLLFALLGLAGFAGAWAEFHKKPAGPATLLVALLPIMQPFTGMAYSDVPGIAVLLWAWWAQLRQQYLAAAVLLVLACLIRQTNIIWGAFFVVWEFSRAWVDDSNQPVFATWRSAAITTWKRPSARHARGGRSRGTTYGYFRESTRVEPRSMVARYDLHTAAKLAAGLRRTLPLAACAPGSICRTGCARSRISLLSTNSSAFPLVAAAVCGAAPGH